MIGMDRHTGQPLSGIDHVRQSIEVILSTPLGSRRMRPEFGSQLRRYVDMPVNEGWKGAVSAETVRAVGRWEPRVKLEQVSIESILDGKITLRLQGEYLGDAAFDLKVTV